MRDILVKYFINGFSELLKSHFEDNHMWFYGKSVFKAVKDLHLKKSEVIFFLMGSNKLNPGFGSMSDYDMVPAGEIVINKCKKIAKELYPEYETSIEFTEKPMNDGNFKIFLQMKEIDKVNIINNTDSRITYAKILKSQVSGEEKVKVSSPAIERLFSSLSVPVKVETVKNTEVVNISSKIEEEMSSLKKENERLKFENSVFKSSVDELKMENKILKGLIDNFLSKSSEPTCVKSDALKDNKSSSEKSNGENTPVEVPCNGGAGYSVEEKIVMDKEMEEAESWDDVFHPPSPKKNFSPKK